MKSPNSDLAKAFPRALRDDALVSISTLPEATLTAHSFPMRIGSEAVEIPYRIYHDPALIHSDGLTPTQNELLACLLTRHHSGFVREENLKSILDSGHEWVPPFVVQLAGEYVIEIVSLIRDNIQRLDPSLYRAFLIRNPAFYRTTKKRVLSYWNCYHRDLRRADYAGFQVLEAFDHLLQQ
jgi:hypothetical protein